MMPMPPQLEAAYTQLKTALSSGPAALDVEKATWPELEKGVIRVLGGPFRPDRGEHQVVALGLAGVLASRLAADHGAFFFPYRETPEAAALGFPGALMMLSPFTAVVDALAQAKLERLSEVEKEIRTALAQVKFSAGAGAPVKLTADDYMRLFDPGFVQLLAMDPAKVKQTLAMTPERLASEIRDAVNRAGKLTPEVKKQIDQQFVGALTRLEPGKPLSTQVGRAARLVEMMVVLFASIQSTGAAAEEFWYDVVMPLLFVGTPAQFPPLDEEEQKAAREVDPLFLFLDVVPYQFKAPEEEGLLGAFPATSLDVADPAFKGLPSLRLIKVGPESVKEPLQAFDQARTRDAVKRFGDMVAATGKPAARGAEEAKMMLDAAMTLLSDLKMMVAGGKELYFRRLTEAEAASEPALAQVRQALSAPRIILAT